MLHSKYFNKDAQDIHLDNSRYIVIIGDILQYNVNRCRKEQLKCLGNVSPINFQVMEENREYHHGYTIESTKLASLVCIAMIGHSVLIKAEGKVIGRRRGYRRNGKDLIASVCIEAADHLVMAGHLGLAVREAAFSGAVM